MNAGPSDRSSEMTRSPQQFDRLPPQNLDAERALLGSMLLSHEAIDDVVDLVHPSHFYADAHIRIAESIFRLSETTVGGIDAVTVAEDLERRGELDQVGGAPYLARVLETVPHAAHARFYAEIVRDKYVRRMLRTACTSILREIDTEATETDTLLGHAEEQIFQILHDEGAEEKFELRDILEVAMHGITERMRDDGSVSGVSTGYERLDDLTSGFQPQALVIVAARPSMGKTAFVCNVARNIALDAWEKHNQQLSPSGKGPGGGVVIFSLEQSRIELAERLLCIHGKLDGLKVKKGDLDEEEARKLLQVASRLSELPIYVDDQPGRNMAQIAAICRRVKNRNGLGLIIIDYLQLIEPDDVRLPREQQVAQIARRLKFLAKEMNVPVIALAQLNRGVELRTDKRPKLADLRECVPGDTLVCLADGSRIPIRQLVGTQPEVLALSPEGRVVRAVSDKVWHVGRRPLLELRLASGRRLRCTKRHRIYGAGGWVRAADLCPGDRVAIARELPEPADAERWPDAEVILLGHLLGDGSYLSGQPLRYCTSSEENSRAVCLAAEHFGVRANRYAGRRNWHTIVFSGNGNRWQPAGVNRWLRDLGIFNQRSHEKRIPAAAFRLGNEQVALLLRHLWATDGCIAVPPARQGDRQGAPRVYLATNSRGLAEDVAALLLRLGIVARMRTTQKGDYRPGFSVDVSGGAAQFRFLETVGAFGPRVDPAGQLRRWLGVRIRNTNVDTLPRQIFDRVKTCAAERGISWRAMAAARGTAFGGSSHFRFAPSRQTVREYADILKDAELTRMATSDLFWDRLISVTPAGEEDVYDLTVPGPASWLADGIVSHNSGSIEQDADLVMFLHREDAYDPSERPGEADLIVAKNRNGPTGMVGLTWIPESMRFENRSNLDEPEGGWVDGPVNF